VQDFAVLDNKKPQKVTSFTAVGGSAVVAAHAEPPAQIIIMVDEVNTNFDRVAYERDEIRKFAMQNGGKLAHPVSIGFFTDHGSELQNGSTQDGNLLMASFDKHETALRSIRRDTGFYGAVERFQLSLNMLNTLAAAEAQRPGRKMVIWISPGWPYFSGPRIDLSSREEHEIFASIIATSTALRHARITLYSIDPLGVSDAGGLRVIYYEEFLKPVTKANNAEAGSLALQVIATQSGGMALNSSNDISAQIDRCIADADAYYTMTIDEAPSELPNEFHAIDVKVESPGLSARTRYGYYGQP
jgi:VWFA-related protein